MTANYAHCQAHVTHADRSWFSTGARPSQGYILNAKTAGIDVNSYRPIACWYAHQMWNRYKRADMNASVALFKGMRNQVKYGRVHYARLIYDPFLRLCSFWHETQIYSLNLTADTTRTPIG